MAGRSFRCGCANVSFGNTAVQKRWFLVRYAEGAGIAKNGQTRQGIRMKHLMLSPFFLFFALGLAAVLRLIPPNSSIGYRTGRTLSDETIWYSVNYNVGWSLIITSILGACFTWKLFASNYHLTVKSIASTAALVLLAVITIVVGINS